MPAKQEPGSISATSEREVRSTRFSTRFQYRRISRASQCRLIGFEEGVIGQHLRRIAFGLEHDDGDVAFVGAQIEDGVVQFARKPQRPEFRAELLPCLDGLPAAADRVRAA